MRSELSESLEALERLCGRLDGMAAADIDLVSLEREVQECLNEIGSGVMKRVFRRADTQQATIEFEGRRWGNRRESSQTYVTVFGTVQVARSIYQSGGGGPLLIPMDVRLGIVEKRYTPRVARLMTLGLSFMPAEECARYLAEAGVAQVSKATISRIPLDIAARYEKRRDEINELLRQTERIPDEATVVQVGLDGVMVPQDGEHAKARGRKASEVTPARHERHYGVESFDAPQATDGKTGRAWHEASVGTIGFWSGSGELLHTIYVGRMPESGMASLHAELQRELSTVLAERPDLQVQFASDGDAGQWNFLEAWASTLESQNRNVSKLLDFYHAAEYVAEASKLVAGDDTPESRVRGKMWRCMMKEHEDGALRVIKGMRHQRTSLLGKKKKDLDRIIKYLAKHDGLGRMRYAQAKKAGLPIGTGITEAAAKTLVGTRMKRAGARFSQHGGQTVLTFRAAEKSGRFERLSSAVESTYRADLELAA